jgi:hypothetical protein
MRYRVSFYIEPGPHNDVHKDLLDFLEFETGIRGEIHTKNIYSSGDLSQLNPFGLTLEPLL